MKYILSLLALLTAVPANAQTTVGDASAYASGSYLAYLAPFGKGLMIDGIGYSEAMIVQPGSFPANTSMLWNWPANTNGIVNFLAIDFGDYNNTVVPTPITPKKLMNISTLNETHSLTLSGSVTGYDAIIDFFTTSAPGSNSTKQHEVEILLHTPTYAAAYVASLTPIGTYTDANGLAWTVVADKVRLPHDIIFMPANQADVLTGSIDIKAMIAWLMSKSWVGGGEYFNGLGLGIEVQQGIGAASINSFSVNYQ